MGFCVEIYVYQKWVIMVSYIFNTKTSSNNYIFIFQTIFIISVININFRLTKFVLTRTEDSYSTSLNFRPVDHTQI